MSFSPQASPADLLSTELERLRKSWFLMLILGIVLIVVGMFAISATFVTALATIIFVGVFLLMGGGVEIVTAFWGGRWRGFWTHLLIGILYLVLGFLMVGRPGLAVAACTLMIAAALLIGGLFRIIFALTERFQGWGWVLVNGIISLILGLMIWRDWPESAFWAIGLFVGIDMLFAGWSWVMTALAVRSMPGRAV
jgi:uncharacterized membrane protein HdeD (DUF308 family)